MGKHSNHDPLAVLRERMNGKTYGEIAEDLGTDLNEVMQLAKKGRRKLGASRNQQAVAMLQERELVSTTNDSFTLSPTQKRIGDLLIAGKTNGEIATEMQVSVHTTKTHISRMMEKTGTKHRDQLAALIVAARKRQRNRTMPVGDQIEN
ncbi:MAG TPA: LuxR C-terminal-related transcriptional regulator [Candidatus Saccharimonadales bacterium]|nr:LuxR C-terminal-related transcriptional regulator [Candidatus Saccharimonadales bacterium]